MAAHLAIGRLVFALTLGVLAWAGSADARPGAGSVDRSFGGDGRVVLNLPGERMSPTAMAVQPDGKIVVAGSLSEGRVLALRFHRDGTLDQTFGAGGIVRATLSYQVGVRALAVQPDGGLLLAGAAVIAPGQADGAVLRLLPDGRVDAGFGENGLTRIDPGDLDFGSESTTLTHLAMQADGRIVAAGYQESFRPHDRAYTIVARLLPDGRLDETFDGDGVGFHSVDFPGAIVIHPDGHVLVLGWSEGGIDDFPLYAIRFSAGPSAMPSAQANPDGDWRLYDFKVPVTAAGAGVASDETVVVAAQLSGPRRFGWLRIGPDLRELDRGTARGEGVHAVAFDARGALITAGKPPLPSGAPPVGLERWRGLRLSHDRSFGRAGTAFVSVMDPAVVIGTAVHRDKVLLAATTDFWGPPDHPLTLVRLHAHQDGSGPIATVRGLPRRRCVDGVVRPLVRVRDESAVRVELRVDRRVLARSRRHRIRVPLNTSRLRPGPHKLIVTARDAAGNLGRSGTTFVVCGRG